MSDFFEENKEKIVEASIWEFDQRLNDQAKYDDGYDEGYEDGREQGREEGKEEGLEEGREEGRGIILNTLGLIIKGFDTVDKLVSQGVPESDAVCALNISREMRNRIV